MLLEKLRNDMMVHPGCDYDEHSFPRLFTQQEFLDGASIVLHLKRNLGLAKESVLDDLSRAILRQSLPEVNQILEQQPSTLKNRTAFGHTVLHLAADWPAGMSLLLSCGACSLVNIRDNSDSLPLEHSCKLGCYTTTRMLLKADSCIDLKILHYTANAEDWSIFALLLGELADRATRLQQLAECELPTKTYQSMELPSDHPMDGCCAVRVLEQLRISSVCIPEALAYPGSTRYSGFGSYSLFDLEPKLNPTAADYIWSAGFRFHCNSKTLFHKYVGMVERLDWALWLISKGLSTSDMNFHDFMRSAGWYPWEETEAQLYSHEERLDLFWEIYSSPVGVDHQCACSVDGCIPALSISRSNGGVELCGLSLAECCGDRVDDNFWPWLAPRVIRCFLFGKLDLTHSYSCCKNNQRYDQYKSGIRDKQEEEWHLRSRLDSLVQELVTEYEELDIPLSRFLNGRVRERACEVLEGEEEPSEEVRKNLRAIGVVLEAE